MPASFLASFNACTARMSLRARASGWRTWSASFIATEAARGRRAWWTAGRHFPFQYREETETKMEDEARNIKNILLVEGDPRDMELTLTALEENRLANRVA